MEHEDVKYMREAIRQAKQNGGKPHAIVLNTIKGKGCTFAENQLKNHHINVTKDQAAEALKALKNG